MIKILVKIVGLVTLATFLFVGCNDEKTTVTTVKKSQNQPEVVPQKTGAIKTH
ncbi:hypothetical protein [Sulfurospirillum sp. 1612]|uniref:hypothetical protein n=1 Tax=Sulfurospirillum sp. 1612 TaxID=3094835 RepID=UPI002F9465B0